MLVAAQDRGSLKVSMLLRQGVQAAQACLYTLCKLPCDPMVCCMSSRDHCQQDYCILRAGHTIACAYQGAEMKLARSKFCKGPRPLGGQVDSCTRLLLAP